MPNFAKTPRTSFSKATKRSSYDRDFVYAILDEALVAHVGFATEEGPFVVPINFWRRGDFIYFHGPKSGRLMDVMRSAADLCVTVSLNDGLVMARSAFHHSMNYRSVVIFGRAQAVDDDAEKMVVLKDFINGFEAGRWDKITPPSVKELNATSIMRLPLEEVSAKMRSGPASESIAPQSPGGR